MIDVYIDSGVCPANHKCPVINICPKSAIVQKTIFTEPEIDKNLCTNCGLCVKYCGYKAFKKREV